DLRVRRHRLAILNIQLRGDRPFLRQLRNFSHHLIQQHGDDPAMDKACSAAVPRTEYKLAGRTARLPVHLKRELHPKSVSASTAETMVSRIRRQDQLVCHLNYFLSSSRCPL